MSLRLYGTISGWGRSAGAVIPALGSGRYSPGPNIVLPSWRKGADPHCTLNVFWGQPGALATVSLVFQCNPDESQRLYWLGRQLAASRCNVGMARPPQQANGGVASRRHDLGGYGRSAWGSGL